MSHYSFLSVQHMSHILCSPGLLADSQCLRTPEALGPVRGGFANPGSRLCPLVNMGGYRVDGVGISPTPYSTLALSLLDACPVEDFTRVRAIQSSPKSTLFHRIASQMLEVHALRFIRQGALANIDVPTERDLAHAKHPAQKAQLHKLASTPRVCGILRAVYKDSEGEARAIFDLVYTNSVSAKRRARFGILGSGQLLDLVRTIPFQKREYRFVHGDLKNAYYQLPIGPGLGRCCCLRIGDDLYEPLVLPMGYHEACGICQGIVFATILFREDREDPLGVDPSEYDRPDAPAMVRLDDGGFISLVYDSFLIVTTETRAKAWEDRVRRNFNRVNGVLKYLILEEKNFARLPYCGIVFSKDGHGVSWSMEEESVRIWHITARQELLPRRLTTFICFDLKKKKCVHRIHKVFPSVTTDIISLRRSKNGNSPTNLHPREVVVDD